MVGPHVPACILPPEVSIKSRWGQSEGNGGMPGLACDIVMHETCDCGGSEPRQKGQRPTYSGQLRVTKDEVGQRFLETVNAVKTLNKRRRHHACEDLNVEFRLTPSHHIVAQQYAHSACSVCKVAAAYWGAFVTALMLDVCDLHV